ncbi:MAG: glycosyltransferase family 2 protein [Mucilaginibacter sp.]
MANTKISLITVCYNAEAHIGRCIESVIAQNYPHLEYIIIDGGSTDQTLSVIKRYEHYIAKIISEPDKGVYDAMNKGILLATGNVIGTLNADDFFAAPDVLTTIGEAFGIKSADILYGDLDYIDFNETIIRKWRTKKYINGIYNWGWMPPHPTFYCKRSLFEELGLYKLGYGTAADYELMLRFMHQTNLNAIYINKVLVKMQRGGLSNRSFSNRLKAWGNDLKAMRDNGIRLPLLTLLLKPARKILQFL